ncbi:MAG: Holliday junction resolvase RuvX [Alphaproteobacteria bacterium]
MAIRKPTDLAKSLARGQCLLGLDVGRKTIGIALSDSGLVVATPLTTIARTRFAEDARRVSDLMAERRAGGLVVGLPLNMDGSEGPMCQSVRQFAANLLAVLGDIPIAFWDERLSTAAVERAMLEADVSRRRRAKAVDKLAAAYILQGLLDRLRRP